MPVTSLFSFIATQPRAYLLIAILTAVIAGTSNSAPTCLWPAAGFFDCEIGDAANILVPCP